ncbi:HEAT repeat domain-containing protein [bacterium]|nr:HEAT repeat domain-containing protein [bacterium]
MMKTIIRKRDERFNPESIDLEEIKKLIKKLQDPDWSERKRAAYQLQEHGDEIVPYLEKTLSFDNEDIRYWSTIILARIGGNAVAPLITQLSDSDREMRAFAAKALGETQDPRVIDHLINALGDESWSVRRNAAESLINMGKVVIKPLAGALKNKNEDIRYWAIRILGELGSIGLDPLILLLEKGTKDMRILAAEAVGETKDERAVPYLIKVLSDKSWSVRKNAAKSLEKLGEVAVPDLTKELSNKNPDVQYWIVKILGNLGKYAVKEIISSLNDEDSLSRYGAEKIFEYMGKIAVEPLIEILKFGKKEMRKNAAEALGNTNDVRAIPMLIDALKDESWFVRKNAASALEEYGEAAIADLTKALTGDNEDIQFWATKILAKVGIKNYDPLLKILEKGSKDARFFAIEALSKCSDKDVVTALIRLFKDKSWPVRNKAAEAIISLEKDALPEIIKNLKNDNNNIRFWSTHVLQKLSRYSRSYLMQSLHSGDMETTLYSIFALGELGDRKVMNDLYIFLDDSNEWIRRTTVTSLINIDRYIAFEKILPYMLNDSDSSAQWIIKSFANLEDEAFAEFVFSDYFLKADNIRTKRILLSTVVNSFPGKNVFKSLSQYIINTLDNRNFGWFFNELYNLPIEFLPFYIKATALRDEIFPSLETFFNKFDVEGRKILKGLLETASENEKTFIAKLLSN